MPAHVDINHAWQTVRTELRRLVGEDVFEIWLSQLALSDWDGLTLTLSAPADKQAWISDRYARVLRRCASQTFGPQAKVSFAPVSQAPEQRPLQGGRSSRSSSSKPGPSAHEDQPGAQRTDLERFNPRHTFDQFIIGDGNRLAHAAALAVAEAPGQAYNPLFLYAPPGFGKTHLLHAIGNYISNFDPGTRVRYSTAEAFTNHFISSINHHATAAFKHAYRDADVLLIDDVQFLAAKAKTEEEFFHTFNALYDAGSQLVVTADCLPRELSGVEDRLCARFESGLVAQMQAPNRATRIAILRKRAALDSIELPDPTVLELIADRVTGNVRALEGALIRVVAHHSLSGRPLDHALAVDVLDDLHPTTRSDLTAPLGIQRIQALVAGHFNLTREDLTSPRRTAALAWPRQLAIYLTREFTDCALTVIGAAFGGRNHATVLHACKRVEERIIASDEDAAELTALRGLLTASGPDRSS